MEQSSGEGKSSTGSLPKKILQTFLFLLLINTFVNLFLSKPTIFDLIKLKKLREELSQKTKIELSKRRKLEFLKSELERNPKEFMEMLIRDYLMKVKKGENVILIKEKEEGEGITR
ncbi:hypothetical protein [Aquifex aeolicus]|uniref:hypothetical protein n=1 Tax=Aquifex aeolicus TaxID=63363 RepID=UPI0003021E03|nr:hypothetical protein [Aquifex aeolicus]